MSANTKGLKKPSLFPVLIIATLAIGLYSNTLKNGFVHDDINTIVDNTFARRFDNLPLLLDKTAYFNRSMEMSYRPVVTFTYFIDYAFYGLKPWGYHLTNILLHAINGVLLYSFLALLLAPHPSRFTSPTFLISILFVSHPVLTEAVNCISFREDLLAFLFYMATLSLYLILRKPVTDHLSLTTALFFLFSCLTYLFALLSKEMAVTLPLFVFCYEWFYGREKTKLPSRLFNYYIIGYITITLFYLYLRFYLFYNPLEEQIKAWNLVERFLTLPWLIMSYIKLSLFPVHLSADYVINPVNSPFSPLFILSIIIIVSMFIMIMIMGSREKIVLFGALFFLITLAPVYNLVPISRPFAERYIYLPLVGFVMPAVYISYLIADKLRPAYENRYMPAFFLIVLIVFSFSVVKRNGIWKDSYSLWSDTVAKMPNSSRAHNNLGRAYYNRGRTDEAIEEFIAAIKLEEFNNPIIHNNLGAAYLRQGRYDEAIYELKTAIRLKPDYITPYYNLGKAYRLQGLFNQAINEFLAAIRLKPDDAELHYNLGIAYLEQGHYDEAISEFSTAVKLKPDYKEAYQNLKGLMEKRRRAQPRLNQDKTVQPSELLLYIAS